MNLTKTILKLKEARVQLERKNYSRFVKSNNSIEEQEAFNKLYIAMERLRIFKERHSL